LPTAKEKKWDWSGLLDPKAVTDSEATILQVSSEQPEQPFIEKDETNAHQNSDIKCLKCVFLTEY